MKPCNWCGSTTSTFVQNKSYCTDCSRKCFRECVSCHKPYPHEKYFLANETRCNSCEAKNEKRRLQRKMKIMAEENNARHFNPEYEGNLMKRNLDGNESDKSLTDEETVKLDSDGEEPDSGLELSNDDEEKYQCGVTLEKSVFDRIKAENLKRKKGDLPASEETDSKKKRKYKKRTKAVDKSEAQENLLRAIMNYQSKFPKKSTITICM